MDQARPRLENHRIRANPLVENEAQDGRRRCLTCMLGMISGGMDVVEVIGGGFAQRMPSAQPFTELHNESWPKEFGARRPALDRADCL